MTIKVLHSQLSGLPRLEGYEFESKAKSNQIF